MDYQTAVALADDAQAGRVIRFLGQSPPKHLNPDVQISWVEDNDEIRAWLRRFVWWIPYFMPVTRGRHE